MKTCIASRSRRELHRSRLARRLCCPPQESVRLEALERQGCQALEKRRDVRGAVPRLQPRHVGREDFNVPLDVRVKLVDDRRDVSAAECIVNLFDSIDVAHDSLMIPSSKLIPPMKMRIGKRNTVHPEATLSLPLRESPTRMPDGRAAAFQAPSRRLDHCLGALDGGRAHTRAIAKGAWHIQLLLASRSGLETSSL